MVTEPEPGRPTSPGLPLPAAHLPSFANPPGERMPDPFASNSRVTPQWYRRAVFYEVLVRGFQDANGDGTGDISGLTSRLDYLQWLGIDCIWLLPIYESPLRDGGYDIADYMQSCRTTATWPTSWNWWRRPISAASGSSPTWS